MRYIINHSCGEFELDGDRLIKYHGNAEKVTIPEKVTVICSDVFSGNTQIRHLVLPKKMHEIERIAFSGCINLECIDMPETLEILGEAAFAVCKSLRSITIPEGVRTMGHRMFIRCVNLREAVLPKSLCATYSMFTESPIERIYVYKGTFAEKIAELFLMKTYGSTDRIRYLPGEVETGFYPSYVSDNDELYRGYRAVSFFNPTKHIYKIIIDDHGKFEIKWSMEHPELIRYLYKRRILGFVDRKTFFHKDKDRFKIIWTLQNQDDVNATEPAQQLSVYAYLNDEGEFITPFRIYQYGDFIYEGTDREKKDWKNYKKIYKE